MQGFWFVALKIIHSSHVSRLQQIFKVQGTCSQNQGGHTEVQSGRRWVCFNSLGAFSTPPTCEWSALQAQSSGSPTEEETFIPSPQKSPPGPSLHQQLLCQGCHQLAWISLCSRQDHDYLLQGGKSFQVGSPSQAAAGVW